MKVAEIENDILVIKNIEDEKVLEDCKAKARALAAKFPLYPEGYFED